jgi:hypothetical protein
MGKSETVLRPAPTVRYQAYGWKVFFLDCKGEQALQERCVATLRAAGAHERIGVSSPSEPLVGWQGDSTWRCSTACSR